MTFEGIAPTTIWRELPRDEHDPARAAMRAIAKFTHLVRSPQISALDGSAYPGSYRLRFGRYRILFVVFPDERAIVFTTAFLKRREADYGPAIERHDARVRSYE